MKVVGFSFVRNAIQYDYPIVEAIQSILPICDAFVVAVGQSDDETLQLIQSIQSDKLKIIETVWDDRLREGGEVLAVETNKAFDAIANDADWCFYIQGDELVHENDLPHIQKQMQRYKDEVAVEGLLFNYRHFYGSYDYIGNSRRWYRKEIRIIRKDQAIRSYKDAQGFRKNGKKLQVKQLDAYIHHYGWVKHPQHQQLKQRSFNKLWHDDDWVDNHVADVASFDYSQIDSLEKFDGSHPKVLQERIAKMNWQFDFDPTQQKKSLKEKWSNRLEAITGYRIGEYKNYSLLK